MRCGSKWWRVKRSGGLLLFVVMAAVSLGLAGCSGSRPVSEMDAQGEAVGYIYGIPMDENAGVVTENAADLYSGPDVKSPRVTQVLYNQPVGVLQQEQGWAKVTAVDGSTGWIKLKYIDRDVSSIYGRTFSHRIIVTSREKSVTSTPSGGITQVEALMGTEFFAFNSSGDAYEVFLPGNKTGWLRGSGIIHVELNDAVPVTNADDFAATALRLKGASYLLNGISAMGIDSAGLVYICARINGINLPRSLEGQLASGTEIKPEDSRIGDLVFLAGVSGGETEKVGCVGICTGGGNYLYAGRKTGYVAVGDINRENADGRVMAVRRIFN
jgi:SH3-like domain-containing protein